MTIRLTENNDGTIVEVQVSGKLTDKDYEQFVPVFDRLVKQQGKVRVLFDMVDFHGWELGALWDDIKFDITHFSSFEMLAMVGDKAWEKGMSVLCRPFTTARIKYFERTAIEEARQWLASPL